MFSLVLSYLIVFHYVNVAINMHGCVVMFSAACWSNKSGAVWCRDGVE